MKEITDLIIEIDYEQIATYNFPKIKKREKFVDFT